MSIERTISSWLNRYPAVKAVARSLYVRCFVVIGYWKREKLRTKHKLRLLGENNSFFGYYDFNPVRNGQSLYHSTRHNVRDAITQDTTVDVKVENRDGDEIFSQETGCFNWQQGARANWLSDTEIVFNSVTADGTKVTRSINIESGEKKDIEGFHYQNHDHARFYFLNYHFIGRLRPDYGYFNKVTGDAEPIDESLEGIFFSYRDNPNDVRLLLSLARVREELGVLSDADLKINHLMPNASGSDFIVICRVFSGGKRSGCLVRYNHDSDRLTALTEFGTVSHLTWQDDSRVFGFFETKENGITYQSLDIKTGEKVDYTWLKRITKGDGHPTFLDSDTLVTDTYPDRYRNQFLYKVNLQSKSAEKIFTNFHPIKYVGVKRCDFHPRKIDESTISIDTIVDDRRKFLTISLLNG